MTLSTVPLNPGSGGARPLVDADLGSVNRLTPPAEAVAQMVEQLGRNVSFWPGYGPPDAAGVSVPGVDDGGALVTRGAVLTDEGTFRLNFANTSLAVGLGAVTVSGRTVTGTGFATADAHYKDYFKLAADGDSAWTQIDSIDSDTQITLAAAYPGASSGTGQRAVMRPVVGSGGSLTVASGQGTIASGTTTGAVSGVVRFTDYAPLVFRARLSVSQRIANQATLVGLREDAATARWFARFRIEGTTATTVICETGRNPTQAPSASETEQTTVTLPFGLTTAALLEYRVELLTEVVRFFVNGVRVAEHARVLPHQHDEMASVVEVANGTSPASSTSLVVDYVTGKNHNKLETGVMSDGEQIIAAAAPLVPFAYSQAGVIAINTDVMVLDCRQIRSLLIHCRSMGTTGVITVQWSNEPTFASPVTATLLSEAGAIGTTFNAAGLRYTNVLAAFCRLRMTTATTAGTTTLEVWGSQIPIPVLVGTQPVSGTVTASNAAGTAAEDAAASGNPVLVGGVVRTAVAPTTLVAGDVARFSLTSAAQLVVKPFAPAQTEWTANLSLTTTTAQALAAAAAAGIRNHITSLWLINTGASAVDAFVLDGATERARYPLPPNVPVPVEFPTGIVTTAATALNINLSAAGTVRAVATGYTAP